MSYSLRGFNGRGSAEVTRVIFAIANVNYEDFRYPIDPATFARPEQEAAKADGTLDANLGRLPILFYTENGVTTQIGQSRTIERFVARELGFLGSNKVEAAVIDSIAEHVRDIKQKYIDGNLGKKDEELLASKAKFIAEELPGWFAKLEKVLTGTNGFAIGNKISLADVAIHSLVQDYFDDKAGAAAAASAHPRLVASAEKVAVAAKTWLETRPVTKF